ncbi:iron-hydroxamate transporter permease [Marinobacter lutaoensis]|uniref:Iron-hydroxamate transporter permease n=1 Tax=Marinobacter lutaoensis TaxID=135739 RepID=A0A1V2DQ18_9GAMM|nr:iron ABC transporter permease [Marinobacter lutaoensis]ONF42763.1 iron-hydroxamate transporter permease [Marinobacter lutaoensis]
MERTLEVARGAHRPELRATWLGLLLLLALAAWQGLLRDPALDWRALTAPWQAHPDLNGLLLWDAQLPRLVAGVVVGLCLGLAGALMQLITRNPLVSPDLLGITAGAQLGVILSLLLPATLGLPVIFFGGVTAALLTFALAGGGRTTPLRLVLAGVAMAQAFYALITLFLTLNQQAAMVVSLWDTGSLNQMGWAGLKPAVWLVPPLLLLVFLMHRPLNMTLLGDTQMRMLGVSPRRLKVVVILIGTLLTALAIHLAGPLGFIGLVAPNLVRYGLGVRWPSRLLPLAALWGAVLTLAADVLVASLPHWLELPLGTLSAMLGALAVLWLLRLSRGRSLPGPADGGVPEPVGRRLPLRPTVLLLALALVWALWSGVLGGDLPISLAALVRGDGWAWTLLDLRLPRLLVDAFGGILFALSGLILQAVTRNPLASPSVLGVSQMAALAVLAGLVMAPDLPVPWRLPIAWAGAVLGLGLILGLNLRHGLEPLRLILTGFALTGLAMALTSLLIAYYSQNVTLALVWMSGSSYASTWTEVWSLLPWVGLGLLLAWLGRRWLDLLALGDGVADSLGLAAARKRLWLLILASLMIAAAVSVLGPVAFVGLLVPHAVRLMGFRGYRDRLRVTPWLGALLLVSADLLGQRLLAPLDVPLGIMTAALGAPLFLLLLTRTYLRKG